MPSVTRFTSAGAMAILMCASVAAAQEHSVMPPGMTHEQHMAQMKKEAELREHGGMAMGFDQDKATHHFTISREGGVIAIEANDPADQTTRDRIRAHLGETARAFASGDFAKPLMTHGELPPGAADMERLKTRIAYRFEESEHGGAVWITTTDPEALRAVQEFLRYQIREHVTGDPLTVQK